VREATFVRYGYDVFMKMNYYIGGRAYFWGHHTKIFALGLAIYLISVCFKYRTMTKAKAGIMMMVGFCMLLSLEGARTSMMQIAIVFFMARHFLVKPIKLKMLLTITVTALVLFGLIRVAREVGSLDLGRMAEAIRYSRESQQSKWYDPLIETGSSVRTVNLTTMLVPEAESYWHGRSYIQSIVHVIPFLQGVLSRYLGATPSQWLTWTHFGFDAAGTGFSMPAEGYLNFGIAGVFAHMFVIGVVLRRIYAKFVKSPTPAKTLILFLCYGLFLITVRNTVNELLPVITQVVIFTWLIKSILVQIPCEYDWAEEADYFEEVGG